MSRVLLWCSISRKNSVFLESSFVFWSRCWLSRSWNFQIPVYLFRQKKKYIYIYNYRLIVLAYKIAFVARQVLLNTFFNTTKIVSHNWQMFFFNTKISTVSGSVDPEVPVPRVKVRRSCQCFVCPLPFSGLLFTLPQCNCSICSWKMLLSCPSICFDYCCSSGDFMILFHFHFVDLCRDLFS